MSAVSELGIESPLRQGLSVCDTSGAVVGIVRYVADRSFLCLRARDGRAVWIRQDAVRHVDGQRVTLEPGVEGA